MRKFLLLFMILGLTFMVVGCPEDKTEAETATDVVEVLEEDVDSSEDSDIETVEAGDWRLTVHQVKTLADGILTEAADGNIFMVIEMTAGNLADEEKTFSTLLQLTVTDIEGTEYERAFHEDLGESPDGTVAVDGESHGEVLYEVSEDATGLQLTFDASLLEDLSVTVDLGDAADIE